MTRKKKSLTTTPRPKSPHPTSPRGGEKSLTPDPRTPKPPPNLPEGRRRLKLETVLAP